MESHTDPGALYTIDVAPEIVSLGWNSEFILAERYPKRLVEEEESDREWYIIDVLNERVYGPFSYEEFLATRERLAVPDSIKFLGIETAWERAGGRKEDAEVLAAMAMAVVLACGSPCAIVLGIVGAVWGLVFLIVRAYERQCRKNEGS